MIIGISGYIGSGKDTVAKMIQYLETDSRFNNITETNWTLDKLDELPLSFSIWEIKKFAAKLKRMVSLLTGIPVEDLEKPEVKNSFLGDEWAHWAPMKTPDRHFQSREECQAWIDTRPHGTIGGDLGGPFYYLMTVRELLQKLGTEGVRNQVHPQAWVNALFTDFIPHTVDSLGIDVRFPNWVITDCRFPNESQAVKDRGGIVVRVNRMKEFWNDPEWKEGKKVYSQPINLHPSETSLDQWDFDYVIDNSAGLEELLEKVREMLIHFKLLPDESKT